MNLDDLADGMNKRLRRHLVNGQQIKCEIQGDTVTVMNANEFPRQQGDWVRAAVQNWMRYHHGKTVSVIFG